MNAKDKVSVTESIEVEVSNKEEDEAILATLSPEQLAAMRRKFGSKVNSPCPKCGRETRRHQGPDGEDPKNPMRICTAATCRAVFKAS